MKYVIMFTSTPELDAAVPPERAQEVYGRIYQWFQTNSEQITDGGAELHPVSTATTVKHGADGPVVVDGPFSEAKEVVGGFSVIDMPDLDAAIALVKTWPSLELPGVAIEIRPMVDDYSQFEQ
ncbi:YciI family protein [Microbacterium sp. NPDC019599]|uniref:YciI family protein n=1 Tax=Microbacterium sp. NPDC019599 TaxID=3154690 RepID=UPI0033E8D8D7